MILVSIVVDQTKYFGLAELIKTAKDGVNISVKGSTKNNNFLMLLPFEEKVTPSFISLLGFQ